MSQPPAHDDSDNDKDDKTTESSTAKDESSTAKDERSTAKDERSTAKDESSTAKAEDPSASSTGVHPTNRGGIGTLTWLLPAATFLVGLVIGFAVWGASDNDVDDEGQAQGTPSATDSPNPGNGQTATLTVPQSCLDAVEESELTLDLVDEAVQAISDFDAARLQEIVDELQGASERIRELGDECRESADVTVGTPSSTPTT